MQRPELKPSRMVAYGARCTWWDDKSEVGSLPSGLPCCPVCGGVLFEIEAAEWEARVEDPTRAVMRDHPAFMRWLRGRCFSSLDYAVDAWRDEQTRERPERVFGPDHDREPGLVEKPGEAMPAQVVEFVVESAAMRSRSRGWVPAVVMRIVTEDAAGLVCSIEVGDELVEIHENIAVAMERAVEDVRAARKRGR